jgi:hydroxymethylbilane synthase
LTAAVALRLATRGSPQARTQAQHVADAIAAATGHPTELVIVETTGDRQQAVPLHTIGGQGVFVKEVQQAVADGRADVAVHSAKDLPSENPAALHVGAYCARRDPADAVVGRSLAALAAGATVATGSVRRRAQLASVRPDLRFVELRGNIARRLEQVPGDGALVMAVAALDILGLTDRIAERLDPAAFVPAVGQGCVAVECRIDDSAATELLLAVDDPPTRAAVTTERAFLGELGAGCTLPLGAYCDGGTLHGFLATEDLDDEGRPRTVFHEAVELSGDQVAAAAAATALARRARAVVGE